jgi:hypothetical protein
MSERRLILRGFLDEKKERRYKVMMTGQGLITAIGNWSAFANSRKIEEVDTKSLLNTAENLDAAVTEYKEVLAEIKKIKDELG